MLGVADVPKMQYLEKYLTIHNQVSAEMYAACRKCAFISIFLSVLVKKKARLNTLAEGRKSNNYFMNRF